MGPAPTAEGGADASRGCEDGGPCPPGTVVAFQRLVLERSSDGAVRVLGHTRYESDASMGAPLSSGAPTHAVLAYDAAGQVIASSPVSFPEKILLENFDSLEREERKLDRAVAVTAVRAPQATAHLVVVDRHGKELGRIEGSALQAESLRRRGLAELLALVDAEQHPRIGNWMGQTSPNAARGRSHCPHVSIMGAAPSESGLAEAVRAVFDDEPAPPTRLQLEQMLSALQYLSPLQCRALRAIAFVSRPDRQGSLGWQTSVSGGLVFINSAAFSEEVLTRGTERVSAARWRAEMQRTVVHEATHSLHELLDAGDREVDFQANWPSHVRIEAREILDTHMFPSGNFLTEWIRIHRTFVRLGLAAEPWADAQNSLRPTAGIGEAIATAGYMTRYGATAYHDDLAEMAAHVQTRPLYSQFPASEQRDWACKALSAMEEQYVPSKYTAAFVKLGFLKSLHVIEERRYDECVGKAKLPDLGVGVHSVREDGSKRSYDKDIKQAVQFVSSKTGTFGRYQLIAEGLVRFGDQEGKGQFRMEVSTGPKATDKPPIPRGIYEVKGGWIGQRTRIKGEAAGHWGRFQIDKGWIIISEGSRERIRGFIEVRKASRPTAFGASVDNLPDRIFFDIPHDR